MKPKHWIIISVIVAIGLVYYLLKDVPVLRFLGIGKSTVGSDQAMPPKDVAPGGQPVSVSEEKFPAEYGDRGDHIASMQWALNTLLPNKQPLTIDGAWGPKTRQALQAMGMDGNRITEKEYVSLVQQAGAVVNK